MASIKTAVQLYNGITPIAQAMTESVNILINSFEAMQTASGQAIDTSAFQNVRDQMAQLEVAFDGIEQNTRSAETAQQQYNDSIREGGGAADELGRKIGRIAATAAAAFSAKKIIGMADEAMQTNARLKMIVDDDGSVEGLQQKIMGIAQNTGAAYQSTANMIAKLGIQAGDAFASNDELLGFTDQLNKHFAVSNTEAAGVESVMYNLTQALSTGVLRGQDLNAVFGNTPSIIQNIADYLGVSTGQIRDMAAEGQLTADVIKNALLSAADETNAAFEQMPLTWGQLANVAANSLYMAFEPVILAIGGGAQWIKDNWDGIAPIVSGVATAITLCAAAFGIYTVATNIAALATSKFFIALMANPLTWIIVAIVLVVMSIYSMVDALNHVKGETTSAMGVIVGIIFGAGATIANIVIGVINALIEIVWLVIEPFIGVVEFITNVFNGGFDSIADAGANLIGNLIAGFIGLAKIITPIIDAIFGTNWTGEITAAQNELRNWGKNENAVTSARDVYAIDRFDTRKAYDSGYKFGAGIESKISDLFSTSMSDLDLNLNPDEFINDNLYNNVADTAGNTARMADSMEATFDELKYLREIAERQEIDKISNATITIDMSNMSNNITGEQDIDSVVTLFQEKLSEAFYVSAEGVHT